MIVACISNITLILASQLSTFKHETLTLSGTTRFVIMVSVVYNRIVWENTKVRCSFASDICKVSSFLENNSITDS